MPHRFVLAVLGAQDVRETDRGHSRPTNHPLALQARRRRDDEDVIAAPGSPGFEQQRDIEHDQRFAPGAGPRDKALLCGADHRMQDSLETPQRLWFAEHPFPEPLPVDAAFGSSYAGKGVLDLRHRRAARCELSMHLGVGVEQRDPHPPQHAGGRTLAHTDRTGEAEDDHR